MYVCMYVCILRTHTYTHIRHMHAPHVPRIADSCFGGTCRSLLQSAGGAKPSRQHMQMGCIYVYMHACITHGNELCICVCIYTHVFMHIHRIPTLFHPCCLFSLVIGQYSIQQALYAMAVGHLERGICPQSCPTHSMSTATRSCQMCVYDETQGLVCWFGVCHVTKLARMPYVSMQ